jgi:site-specific recombinase XerD
MSKKRASLIIKTDLSDVFAETNRTTTPESKTVSDRMTVEQALATVTRQMEISGNRARTVSDYRLHVMHFAEVTKLSYIDELTTDSIYDWLASMDVSAQTKLTRLKCVKAFLSRCFDNGWIASKFWKTIQIKVDSHVKEGATEREINTLLSVLDLSDFVQLRDATAALLMFKTGIRINTVVLLENKHVDLGEKLLRLDGAIMKNHEQLLLPIDDRLHRLLSVLMEQNDLIRREHRKDNYYVFITMFGDIISNSPTHNNIQKRLNKYAKQYGLKNINPHALRRGFAKSLLDKGASIVEISKALGHSDLAVTTKYLHLDKEEVAENLRKYL